MTKKHSFRFVDDKLNQKLIALLKQLAKGKFTITENDVIMYSRDHEDLIGNDLICSVRDRAFKSWQVVSCPSNWTTTYRDYIIKHKIPFYEEIRDGQLQFLIPRSYRPHMWKLGQIRRI